MASRAARDMASCMKTGGKAKKHDDKKADMAMLKKVVKPSAMKKPQRFAAGGVAKMRLGQSTPAGKQKPAPKRPKAVV